MISVPAFIRHTQIPIDGRPHGIDLNSDILHASIHNMEAVNIWYRARRPQEQHMRRSFQIVPTDQPIPLWLGRHQKTAESPDGLLVWHILENICQHAPRFGDRPAQVPGVCPQCGVQIIPDHQNEWIPV